MVQEVFHNVKKRQLVYFDSSLPSHHQAQKMKQGTVLCSRKYILYNICKEAHGRVGSCAFAIVKSK